MIFLRVLSTRMHPDTVESVRLVWVLHFFLTFLHILEEKFFHMENLVNREQHAEMRIAMVCPFDLEIANLWCLKLVICHMIIVEKKVFRDLDTTLVFYYIIATNFFDKNPLSCQSIEIC